MLKTEDEKIDIATLRAIAALQPRGRAELARAAGIKLPNLSAFLRTGLESLVSKPLRDRFLKEIGLSASGWLRAGCHVWRTKNIDDAIMALQWFVPNTEHVLVRELRSEEELLDEGAALVHVYLLKWMFDERPRRVLLQLRITEQAAVDARRRLIQCGVLDVKGGSIRVVPLAPADYETLSAIGEIGNKAFDDLFDCDVETTWDAVFRLLPGLFGSAEVALGVLQSHAAAIAVSSATRRARGRKGG